MENGEHLRIEWRKVVDESGESSAIHVVCDGDSKSYSSIDDLPDDIRTLLDGFQSPTRDLPETAPTAFTSLSSTPLRARKKRPHLQHAGDKLVLEYRWFAWWVLLLLFFGCPYLFLEAWKMQAQPAAFWKSLGWLGIAVGIGILYYIAANILNTSVIEVCQRHLSVKHGPLPWFGARNLASADIRQLFCRVVRIRHDAETIYKLMALTSEGEVTLLANMRSQAEAVAIERAIERHLGIEDRSDLA